MVATKKDSVSGDSLGTGRRKTAIARVRLKAGSGKITVNDLPLDQYFPVFTDRQNVLDALEATGQREAVDVTIRCTGGGKTGQSAACKMGIARALCDFSGETFPTLRGGGFLTRDSRMKERKKYGQPGARKRFQFSKR
jgi:small subunit ribosomal protein S9